MAKIHVIPAFASGDYQFGAPTRTDPTPGRLAYALARRLRAYLANQRRDDRGLHPQGPRNVSR